MTTNGVPADRVPEAPIIDADPPGSARPASQDNPWMIVLGVAWGVLLLTGAAIQVAGGQVVDEYGAVVRDAADPTSSAYAAAFAFAGVLGGMMQVAVLAIRWQPRG